MGRMALITFGGAMPNAPFNRTFFNVTLGDVLENDGLVQDKKLTLFLTDGSTLEVCQIEELTDQYVALRAYRGDDASCSLAVTLIPYNLIYRIEIAPKDATEPDRLGFNWKPGKPRVAKRRGKRI